MSLLAHLGAHLPVVVAPMAGGPSTPGLVTEAAALGAFGFLAAGYRTPAVMLEEIARVREVTDRFGVNVFVPPPAPVEPAEYADYRARLGPLAERLGVPLPEVPHQDDD